MTNTLHYVLSLPRWRRLSPSKWKALTTSKSYISEAKQFGNSYLREIWSCFCFTDITHNVWPVLQIHTDLQAQWNIRKTKTLMASMWRYTFSFGWITWIHIYYGTKMDSLSEFQKPDHHTDWNFFFSIIPKFFDNHAWKC